MCDIESNKINTFSGNAESIYALNEQSVYFTKMHGTNRVLYKYDGVQTVEVCRDISNIMCYTESETPHLIYEKKSGVHTGMTELYAAYADSEPLLVCDNTYYVMYDDYKPDGNLYYFTSSSESVSWSYVIADQYAETDPDIQKPVRDSFWSILGLSAEYNEAYKKYQDKGAHQTCPAQSIHAILALAPDYNMPMRHPAHTESSCAAHGYVRQIAYQSHYRTR